MSEHGLMPYTSVILLQKNIYLPFMCTVHNNAEITVNLLGKNNIQKTNKKWSFTFGEYGIWVMYNECMNILFSNIVNTIEQKQM